MVGLRHSYCIRAAGARSRHDRRAFASLSVLGVLASACFSDTEQVTTGSGGSGGSAGSAGSDSTDGTSGSTTATTAGSTSSASAATSSSTTAGASTTESATAATATASSSSDASSSDTSTTATSTASTSATDSDSDATASDATGTTATTGPEPACGDGVAVPGEICYVPGARFIAFDIAGPGRIVDIAGTPDGDLVWVVGDGEFQWFTALGDGTFATSSSGGQFDGADELFFAPGDFDGQGRQDMAGGAVQGDGIGVCVMENGEPTTRNLLTGVEPTLEAIATDLDDDGDLDVASLQANGLRMAFNDGAGLLTLGPLRSLSGTERAFAIAEFSGDALPDFAFLSTTSAGVIFGAGTQFAGGTVPVAIDLDSAQLAAGDVTGDGIDDLVFVRPAMNQLGLLRGAGAGSFAAAVRQPTCPDPVWVELEDLDADGHADAIVTCAAGNAVQVLRGEPTGFAAPVEFVVSTGPTHAFADGDVNGDGVKDILVSLVNAGPDYVILLSDP